jgi:hypothetical protein
MTCIPSWKSYASDRPMEIGSRLESRMDVLCTCSERTMSLSTPFANTYRGRWSDKITVQCRAVASTLENRRSFKSKVGSMAESTLRYFTSSRSWTVPLESCGNESWTLSHVNARRTTDDGRRTTDDGRRTTDDGRRTTDDGRASTADVFAAQMRNNDLQQEDPHGEPTK